MTAPSRLAFVLALTSSSACLVPSGPPPGDVDATPHDDATAPSDTFSPPTDAVPTPPSHGRAVVVHAGGDHTCALEESGAVWCWGSGWILETDHDVLVPTRVAGIPPALQLVSGRGHTCVLAEDRTVFCWGGAARGPSGRGTIAGLTDVAQVVAGAMHTCALRMDGTVWCWGNDVTGALGDGIAENVERPLAQVPGVSDAVEISSAQYGVCALLLDGTVTCWGRIDGDSSPGTAPTAALVSGVTAVQHLVLGGWGACALHADRSPDCWGAFAVGTALDPTSAVATPVDMQLGGFSGLALRTGGSVYAWGRNVQGVLGTGEPVTDALGSPSRGDVLGLTDAAMVSLGGVHACALRTDGSIVCWGVNGQGQLGDGTTRGSNVPVRAAW